MPNPHSSRTIKMADNGKEDIANKQPVQPIKITLRAAIEKVEPPPNLQQAGGGLGGAARPGQEASHKPQSQRDAPGVPPVVVSVNGYLSRVENSDRLRLELGKPPAQNNPSPGQQPKPLPATKTSTASKSRYNVSVGPLTNSPAVKPASRGRRNDQRVPSQQGPGRRSKSPMFSLVPMPSPVGGMQVGPPIASAIRPMVEPPPPSHVKYGHQLPAMVTYPHTQQRAADGIIAVAATGKRHAPDVHRPPPAPQQSFPVDPSFNLYMAVECHRATGQDEDGDTPLHIALAQENVDIRLVRRLVELFKLAGKTLDVFNDMQQTPLHIAAITGIPDAARILAENGSNANEADRNGQTAMHNICSNPCQGSRDTLDAILRYTKVKLDLNKRNYSGFSPLHISVKHNLCSLSKVLIDGGANTNVLDANSGWTPLFHAVTNQDAEHVQILLCAGAQVNMQSYSGNTALHVATGRGYTEIVRLLMRYGADMSLRNTHKDTPVMVAQDNNMSNILRGVSSSPSMGSSPHYSSPGSHPRPMTNGMTLKPSPTPSPNVNYQVPTQTALPLGKHGDNPGKKPRATRKDKGSRRGSTAAKNEASLSSPGTPSTTASSSIASDGSGMSQDESDAVVPASHRVSVIVERKSLKRRLIDQNEKDQQDRHSNTPSPKQGDKMTLNKKMKNHLAAREPKSRPRPQDSGNSAVDQSEPMDLTKGKTKDAVVIAEQKKEVVTNGQALAAPILTDKIKDEPKPNKLSIPNGDAIADPQRVNHVNDVAGKEGTIEAVKSVEEAAKMPGCEEEKVVVEAEREVTKTEDKVSDVSTPKKERKRKKSERLPPKKRK